MDHFNERSLQGGLWFGCLLFIFFHFSSSWMSHSIRGLLDPPSGQEPQYHSFVRRFYGSKTHTNETSVCLDMSPAVVELWCIAQTHTSGCNDGGHAAISTQAVVSVGTRQTYRVFDTVGQPPQSDGFGTRSEPAQRFWSSAERDPVKPKPGAQTLVWSLVWNRGRQIVRQCVIIFKRSWVMSLYRVRFHCAFCFLGDKWRPSIISWTLTLSHGWVPEVS